MNLPFEVFMGLRYLRARGQRTNLSLFVWIGVGGVFLGVAALIVVLAVMTGFQDGIRDRIIAANPHLLVYQSGGAGLRDAAAIAARLRGLSGVRSATPFVHQQVLFTTASGGAHGGLIRGIDLTREVVRADVRGQLRSGSLEPLAEGQAAIVLGQELARTLGVRCARSTIRDARRRHSASRISERSAGGQQGSPSAAKKSSSSGVSILELPSMPFAVPSATGLANTGNGSFTRRTSATSSTTWKSVVRTPRSRRICFVTPL